MSETSFSPLHPIAGEYRVLSGSALAALWFSLGVGLLVMQIGAYLVPAVGTREAILAILIGSVIGAGLLSWVARLGCETGLSSAGLMHQVYGSAFGRLPVVLNIVQLIGWASFELVIMRDGTALIFERLLGVTLPLWAATLIWGGLLALLMSVSMLTLVRRFISRITLPLVVLSLLWLSWQFGQKALAQGWEILLNRPGNGGMGMFSAVDLVIAMPISWLPLVADYARHGRSGRGVQAGVWTGYAIANAWCYGLGVLMASVAEPDTDLLAALLLAQGGLVALGLILLDELDNAYGDLYSASVNCSSFKHTIPLKLWAIALTLLATVFAIVLPIHSLEPFLLLLSSVFLPLFGVILGRSAAAAEDTKNSSNTKLLTDSTDNKRFNRSAAALWILGIVVFHALSQWAPQWGASLPTLVLTFLLARGTRTWQ